MSHMNDLDNTSSDCIQLQFRANLGIKRHGDLEDAFSNIKGERFTTYDRDQDTWKTGNCAESLRKFRNFFKPERNKNWTVF